MTFRAQHRTDLPASSSPVRVVDQDGREIGWANRFLDVQRVRGIETLTLRSYAYQLLHFIRWWSRQPGVDVHRLEAAQFHESTLIDYVRDQVNEQPKPSNENVNTLACVPHALQHGAASVPVLFPRRYACVRTVCRTAPTC